MIMMIDKVIIAMALSSKMVSSKHSTSTLSKINKFSVNLTLLNILLIDDALYGVEYGSLTIMITSSSSDLILYRSNGFKRCVKNIVGTEEFPSL